MRAAHLLASTYHRELEWDWDEIVELPDYGWVECSRLAELLCLPEGRWRGTEMTDMDEETLLNEEDSFFQFSRILDERNASR
jgi:hypothetical protein